MNDKQTWKLFFNFANLLFGAKFSVKLFTETHFMVNKNRAFAERLWVGRTLAVMLNSHVVLL